MTLFPSNLCVHRRFILRSFTSRTSNSGGSGGSEDLKESQDKAGDGSTKSETNLDGKREELVRVAFINIKRRLYSTCIYTGVVTLHSELDKASSFSVRVDGMTGEED